MKRKDLEKGKGIKKKKDETIGIVECENKSFLSIYYMRRNSSALLVTENPRLNCEIKTFLSLVFLCFLL